VAFLADGLAEIHGTCPTVRKTTSRTCALRRFHRHRGLDHQPSVRLLELAGENLRLYILGDGLSR
jgi:hypothetical protein